MTAPVPKERDWWEKVWVPVIVGLLSGGVGSVLASVFSYQIERRKLEIEQSRTAIEKTRADVERAKELKEFLPMLLHDTTRSYALVTLYATGYEDVAVRLCALSSLPTDGCVNLMRFGRVAADSTKTAATVATQPPSAARPAPPASEGRAGWVLVGVYTEKGWQSFYLDGAATLRPDSLVGKRLTVRDVTGALNVRDAKPTPGGELGGVRYALGERTPVVPDSVYRFGPGYVWAYVREVR